MAEHVHKTYTCDRCKANLGTEKPRPHILFLFIDVRADFSYDGAKGPEFKWSDLCRPCENDIADFFKAR